MLQLCTSSKNSWSIEETGLSRDLRATEVKADSAPYTKILRFARQGGSRRQTIEFVRGGFGTCWNGGASSTPFIGVRKEGRAGIHVIAANGERAATRCLPKRYVVSNSREAR